jgi:HSP20 family molecular chaperone IbpA
MSFFNTLNPTQNGSCAANGTVPARRPQYEITETDTGFGLVVNLPGVSKEGLEITDEGGALTITGKRTSKLPEGLEVLHRESSDAAFELVLAHDSTVDSEKIEAELKDGVLHLRLAKAESAKPRKIAVS